MQGGAAVGQTSENWMAQQAQYAQYYNQQAQSYAQQGAQGYAQQAAAGGQEASGGMVPIAGMMWPQGQQMPVTGLVARSRHSGVPGVSGLVVGLAPSALPRAIFDPPHFY